MLQRALLAQVEHANADEAPGVEHRHCPYCGRRAAPEAFLTEAQETFVRGYASALEADVRYERLRQVHERLDLNPYVTFALVRGEQVLPRLPAEADDMRRVAVVCCGDELKLRGNLDGGFFCHQCGIRHASSG